MPNIATKFPKLFHALPFLLFSCLTAKAQDYTFDEQGVAKLWCTCEGVVEYKLCASAQREQYTYLVEMSVRDGLTVDLAEKCFREKDDAASDQGIFCCGESSSDFSGEIEGVEPN